MGSTPSAATYSTETATPRPSTASRVIPAPMKRMSRRSPIPRNRATMTNVNMSVNSNMFAHGTRPAASALVTSASRCRPAASQVVLMAMPAARRGRSPARPSASPDRSTANAIIATV